MFHVLLTNKHHLTYSCIVTINVLWLFLTVLWVGQQYVIVVFPDHSHLLFGTFIHCSSLRFLLTVLLYKGTYCPGSSEPSHMDLHCLLAEFAFFTLYFAVFFFSICLTPFL